MALRFGLALDILDGPQRPVLNTRHRTITDQRTLPKKYLGMDEHDIFAQGELWEHLDLATPNSAGPRWDRRTLNRIAPGQPPVFREYLLEARTAPRDGLLHYLHKFYFLDVQNDAKNHPFLGTFVKTCKNWHKEEMSRISSREKSTDPEIEEEKTKEDKEERKRLLRYFIRVCFRYLPKPFKKFKYALSVCAEDYLNDSDFTIEVVRTLFPLRYSRKFLVERVASEQNLKRLLVHAKKASFDFWGIQREANDDFCQRFNFVVECMSSATQHGMASILLQYGFRYSSGQVVYNTQCETFQYREHENLIIGAPNCRHLISGRENPLRTMLSVDTLFCFDSSISDEERKKRQRTLTHLTSTLPDPYLTPDELYNNLQEVVCVWFQEELFDTSESYRKSNIFEGEHLIRQPRNLVHLCRCKIRNVLADYLRLPEGISDLYVPAELVDYLQLGMGS